MGLTVIEKISKQNGFPFQVSRSVSVETMAVASEMSSLYLMLLGKWKRLE